MTVWIAGWLFFIASAVAAVVLWEKKYTWAPVIVVVFGLAVAILFPWGLLL